MEKECDNHVARLIKDAKEQIDKKCFQKGEPPTSEVFVKPKELTEGEREEVSNSVDNFLNELDDMCKNLPPEAYIPRKPIHLTEEQSLKLLNSKSDLESPRRRNPTDGCQKPEDLKIIGKIGKIKTKDEMWKNTFLSQGGNGDLTDLAISCADKELPLKPEKKMGTLNPSIKTMFRYLMEGTLVRLSMENDRILYCYSTDGSRSSCIFINCTKNKTASRSFFILNKETYYLTNQEIKYFSKKLKNIYKKYIIDKIDNPDSYSFGKTFDKSGQSYTERFLNFIFQYFLNQQEQEPQRVIEFV